MTDSPSPLRPAVFFDRDGVVNVSPGEGYVLREEDFHLSPGIIEALAICKQRGFQLILVTSQQGVGKGLMTQATLDAIHAGMQRTLAAAGGAFDGIYSCTHLSGTCTCRKPSPEMILRAQKEHQLDLALPSLLRAEPGILSDLFGSLVGADTLPVRKPDPAPYRLSVERAGGALKGRS